MNYQNGYIFRETPCTRIIIMYNVFESKHGHAPE
jgi:hypothetical protein